MKTGFDLNDTGNDMYENHLKTLIDIVTPVVEKAIILSCEYAKACGRNVVVSKDFEYAAKYCAMRTVGQHIGSHFPEIYEDEDEDEDEDLDVDIVDDDSVEFVRYSGDDPAFKAMNEAYDAWDSWKPQSPVEELLKNAINSNEHCGGMVNE